MKPKNIISAILALGLISATTPNSPAQSKDKEKPSAEVEAKLTEVIKAAYPEAVITGMAKETEDGLSFINVIFTSKGNKIDADVMPDGLIVGTEEAADIKTFPKPARKALKKATEGMMIKGTEIAKTFAKAAEGDTSGTKAVKLPEPIVSYDADVEKDGKKGEFSVNADGTILESPKWAKSSSAKEEEKDEKGEKGEKKD